MKRSATMCAVLWLATAGMARAQGLAARVASAPDGEVRFQFPAKPGVCGYEDAIWVRDSSSAKPKTMVFHGDWNDHEEMERKCLTGPVRMGLTVRGGEVVDAQARVGSPLPAASGRTTELGALSAADAVDLLLDLAPAATGDAADDLLFPVMLADAPPPYPRLLALAANEKVPGRVREKAVFWAAEAGAPASALQRVYEGTTSERVREQVIFAYSRIHDPAGVQSLLHIARSDGPMELRKKAVFWLGQAAGREITKELGDVAADGGEALKVKEAAVFALSQRPRDEAVPALIHVAKTNPDPRVRKRALFWLGQTNDPRAVALFEEILK